MSVMVSLLSWFLLVMAAGGGLHTNSATAEVTAASDAAAVSAYWHTMLPNTLMPAAILELLTPPAGITKHTGGRNTKNVQTIGKMTKDKYDEASLLEARKMGLRSTKEANTHRVKMQKSALWRGPSKRNDVQKSILLWVLSTINNIQKRYIKKSNYWSGPTATSDVEKSNFWWGPPTTADVEKINWRWGPPTTADTEKINWRWGPPTTADAEKINWRWGPPTTADAEKINWRWGPPTTADVEKINWGWGPPTTTDAEKINWGWGPPTTANAEKINWGWGPPTIADAEKSNFFWGPPTADEVEKSNFFRGPPTTDEAEKSNFFWGPPTTADAEKINWGWGPPTTANAEKSNWGWGPPTTDEAEKSNFFWGPPTADEVEKSNFFWGPPTTDEVEKSNFFWGPPTTDEAEKSNFFWGPPTTEEAEKSNFFWIPPTTDEAEKSNFFWGPPTTNEADKSKYTSKRAIIGESDVGRVDHKHGTTMSNNVFLEEALKPGSAISCYVLPSHNTGAPLLRRDVADTVPMSTRNFTDIMTMFAPASNNAMAADVWSTLDHCEHTHALKGETKGCATSVESMVEFAASVLGVSTYNLRAFSSPDAPAEGIMPARGYKVAAATRVTEVGDTITCHGGRFPFAVFMCHTLNPTRVYSVTLDVGAGKKMELLAVCHLDTLGFDPARMPLNVKPGEAPLCHFLSRDSIIWAPAAPASGHAVA